MKISRRSMMLGAGGALAALMSSRSSRAAETKIARPAGMRIPAEDGRHERSFMQWPASAAVYPDAAELEAVREAVARIANAIAGFEPVTMLAPQELHADLRKRLTGAVELWDIPTDDLWCRDSGPAFVLDADGRLAMTDFNFNGWGGKQPHANDAAIASRVAERLGLHLFDNGLVGEHGGVEYDGGDVAVAHESSWVNVNRNKGTREEIGRLLREATGARHLVWAPGLAGRDITDYHIDALARFVAPRTMIAQLPEEPLPEDPFSVAAFETYRILENWGDEQANGIAMMIVPEPYEPRVKDEDFVASYVNFYVCNGAVIMPQFGDKDTDAEAAKTIGSLFPGREVVALEVDAIGRIGGGIHCAVHEQPASTGVWRP